MSSFRGHGLCVFSGLLYLLGKVCWQRRTQRATMYTLVPFRMCRQVAKNQCVVSALQAWGRWKFWGSIRTKFWGTSWRTQGGCWGCWSGIHNGLRDFTFDFQSLESKKKAMGLPTKPWDILTPCREMRRLRNSLVARNCFKWWCWLIRGWLLTGWGM